MDVKTIIAAFGIPIITLLAYLLDFAISLIVRARRDRELKELQRYEL